MGDSEDDWVYSMRRRDKQINDISQELSEGIRQTFSLKTIALEFVDYLFSFIISYAIQDPLIGLAHFIRTGKWEYGANLLTLLAFFGLLTGVLAMFYYFSRRLRKIIVREIISQKDRFYAKVISVVFAFLVIDLFMDLLYYVAGIITLDPVYLDLGNLVDRIIASAILLLTLISIYTILGRMNE